ncbi:unnamed protein product [Schistosoma margrebowiei]|uniref:Uncharacterized protein n=1 Tax=Schistosoma margrebowiei TaxID=48269 RepID=A0A183LVF2_9TREM|nr:unnamed protein product [Schistosoma margrebowiei]
MPLLTTRATIYLGTWNTRTMWESEGVFQNAAEMRRHNLEVIGISETYWTKVGQQRQASGELLLYSGHKEENAPHTQGVALMLYFEPFMIIDQLFISHRFSNKYVI